MKRLICIFLIVSILLSFGVTAFASGGLGNFTPVNSYSAGQFRDVPEQAWYYENVRQAYELGLVKGSSETTFNPEGNLTIAETLALASRLHSIYHTGEAVFIQGDPWYQVYVDYCVAEGIIAPNAYASYSAKATRTQFAMILAAALPAETMTEINLVEDDAIPDVKLSSTGSTAIYRLYRAGILTGSDARGTFNPNSNIKRSEVAAIVTRMVDVSQRKSVTLTGVQALSATEVFRMCSPAVFYIEIYNAAGTAISSGSGVFLSADGKAITNYHVVDEAVSARILTADGIIYDVKGMYDFDIENDLALIQVDGTGFSTLPIGDSSAVLSGDTVFAIGSPLGLENTISQGIISNAARVYEGVTYLQTTASISSGSSGGALINDQGQLIGITCATFTEGQNLNLAVPVNRIASLKTTTLSPLPGDHTQPSTDVEGDDVWSFLAAAAIALGDYDDGYFSYLFTTYQSGSTKFYFYIDYDPVTDLVTLDSLSIDTDGTSSYTALDLSSDLAAPYSGYELISTGGVDVGGLLQVYPQTFTEKSALTFSYFEGPSTLRSSSAMVFTSALSAVLYMTEYYVLDAAGYTLSDLGFVKL